MSLSTPHRPSLRWSLSLIFSAALTAVNVAFLSLAAHNTWLLTTTPVTPPAEVVVTAIIGACGIVGTYYGGKATLSELSEVA